MKPLQKFVEGPLAPWLLGLFSAVLRFAPGRFPADYDEGVYLSASRALASGLLPYRDFVFVHPPGVVLWLLPATWLTPDVMLLVARVASVLVGSLSIVLLARVIGGLPGLAAGLVWATRWEAMAADRGVFLEPLMICAGLAALFMSQRRAWLVAGALLGLSFVFKSWGVFWALLLVLSAPDWKSRSRLIIGAVLTAAVVLAPFAVLAGFGSFIEQTLQVHLRRPPDGDLERLVRLREMFVSHSLAGTLLLIAVTPFMWFSPLRRLGFSALAVAALVVLALTTAAAYWNQYNSALACFVAVVIGVGLDGASRRLSNWVLLAAVVVAAVWFPAAIERPGSRVAQRAVADQLRGLSGQVCAFENYELLIADLSPARAGLIDSYGQQMLEATRDGARFTSMAEAFASEASQRSLRRQLGQCDYLRTGWRGEAQMNAGTKSLVKALFEPAGEGLFKRRAR
ncbi:MAG: hypothetical protein DI536_29340 [Archangium gephyra]|uniref:Glycosyltransferase RgtA/B/C/D-like domain-containing protein n=1 Tax=Archangium gephyra TaxID=48 RepID=A0A2W5T687_9BACT|nr:MAG: hypothetical protein DI536_29340 [Archangium gephyra]